MISVIEVQNLSKYFQDFRAINNISLSIKRNRIYGLVGPNGAGKTTFIKLICGIQNPSNGSIKLFGKENSDISVKSQIGHVSEYSGFYGNMTAISYLKYWGGYCQYKGNLNDRISFLIRKVGLENSSGKQISTKTYYFCHFVLKN